MVLGALCTVASAQVATFDLGSPWSYVGGASGSDDGIDLIAGEDGTDGAAWVDVPVDLVGDPSLHASFDVEIARSDDPGGGLVFAIQGVGPDAIGAGAKGLGYGGLAPSLAVELDVEQSNGSSDPDANHVGVDVDGSIDSVDTGSPPFALASGAVLHGVVDWEAGLISLRLSSSEDNHALLLKIPADLPESPLWVGFTGSAGSSEGARRIDAFSFASDPGTPLPRVFFCATADPRGGWIALAAAAATRCRRGRRRDLPGGTP